MCVLYVALTRAIHATHVVLPFGAKKKNASSGGILLSTLRPDLGDKDRQQGIIYSVGDENWHESIAADFDSDKAVAVDSHFYVPLHVQLATASLATENRSGRGIRRVTPSGLEGGDEFQISGIFSTLNNAASMRRGTLIHACFEQTGWLDESEPSREQLHRALREHSITAEEFAKIYQEFQQLITGNQTGSLLNRQVYLQKCCSALIENATTFFDAIRVEVRNERDFALYIDDALMQGSIDRLVLIYEGDRLIGADVIDFKTDHVDDHNIKDKCRHYAPQLAAYSQAVGKLFGLSAENVGRKLAFVDADRVVSLLPNGAIEEIKFATASRLHRKPHRPTDKNYQMKFWKD